MFTPIGALTSKPYAFVSRPWEINSSEGIDFFDSFLSTIRIDERGLKVIRILPVSNSFNNEVWISDRIRFCYNFQNNQTLLDNFIFYDFSTFFTSQRQISIIFYLSFSKIKSVSYEFGTPTPLEFQSLFFNFFNFFNKNFYILGSSHFSSHNSRDFRNSFFSPDLKIFSNFNDDAFFIVNFNTRLSFPVFNSLFKFSFSNSKFPVFYFGSSFYSNFSNWSNLGSTFFSFVNFITFKSRLNKFFFNQSFSSNFFFPSRDFSNFFSDHFERSFYKQNFKFFPIDFDSSSIISSELNFIQNNFSNSSVFFSEYNFISYNSSFEYNFTEEFPKFIFSIESNFDFSVCSNSSKPKHNTPDFLISFPNIFSFSSTFISVDGSCKSSNNFKKLPNISSYIYPLFTNFFPFVVSENSFYDYFFRTINTLFFSNNSKLFVPKFESSNHTLFVRRYSFSSDSFFTFESARSHYLRSPYSRFSTPLVLQYSRLKSSVFNHSYLFLFILADVLLLYYYKFDCGSF